MSGIEMLVQTQLVITGLVPVIHVFLLLGVAEDVDGRVKPGHDEGQRCAVFGVSV